MPAVAGLRGTGDFGTDERPKDFRETILFYGANGTAPIYALSSKAKKRTSTDPEFHWWNEPNSIVRLQAAQEHLAGVTTITIDSSDPDATNAARVYGTASHLKAGDILMVEKTETSDYDNEHIEVVIVLSDTQFIVKRGVAGSTPATIANDTYMTLIGSAYAEGTGVPGATTRNPIKFYNYTQIFKTPYELTKTADATTFRTGNAWSNDKKRKAYDHARSIEEAIIFGRRYETVGDNGKPKRYMGGLRQFIPAANQTIFGSNITINSFMDAIYPIFDYDTGAGNERLALCGNGALNALNRAVLADANSEINYEGIVKVYGMDLTKIVLPQGVLYLKTHPLMNLHSLYTKSLFALDFDAIRYVAMKDRDTKTFDDVQAKDEDVRRGYMQTECSLQVDYGGLTQAYLGNITYSV
jgi:hypothetical protein